MKDYVANPTADWLKHYPGSGHYSSVWPYLFEVAIDDNPPGKLKTFKGMRLWYSKSSMTGTKPGKFVLLYDGKLDIVYYKPCKRQ